ncbi:MAG: ABC transporter permease [Candidatus Odinarchaeota archaeon]
MKPGTITLIGAFLKDMTRQKAIIFSCFILPVVIIWSTWWVTADFPMLFRLDNGQEIAASMIDVHVITGGLMAMAITAGLFAFIITSENQKIADRLKLAGYSPRSITLGTLLALLTVLAGAMVIAVLLVFSLYQPEDNVGVLLAVILVTLVYAALGNLLGTVYPKVMEGTLLILFVSFLDLMLLTNPMGEGLYLEPWTYFLPGFWTVQLALEAGFLGEPADLVMQTSMVIIYVLVLLLLVQLAKSSVFQRMVLLLPLGTSDAL